MSTAHTEAMGSARTIPIPLGTMKYVAFEGVDGAGKTTQLMQFAKWLERKGITPIRLYEPTYGFYGLQAREMIFKGQLDKRVELHDLLTLDRKEHIDHKIAPLLKFVRTNAGFMLLQDRCYLSAPAYQGTDDLNAMQLLKEEQSYAPRPDAVVLLRVPPELARKRMRNKAGDRSPFTTEEAIANVQARYELVARNSDENVLTVDATGSEDKIHRCIISRLEVSDDQTKQ